MAEETLGSHPEGLMLLEMSFVLWGCQAVLCSRGFPETPAPFADTAVSVDPAARRQVEDRVQRERLDFPLCFHSCQKPI